ncbi:MAG: DegT/DnrJ/EryC1/StrS family aminotransferase [Pseudomonadota bacterium]
MVPFVDLRRQNLPLGQEIQEVVSRALDSSGFILGREVEAFEREFAAYCGARFGVGVGNGTDALTLALAALGVGRGDCVLTVANTFIATAEAITNRGATPGFIECGRADRNMDPVELERHLRQRCRRGGRGELMDIRTGGRLKAVIPVHLYGYPADMDAIRELAHAEGLAVVEDAAQAHGARYKGRPVGGIGDCGCFSFYPAKNLGALGDAGMVVTNDERLQATLRLLRDHGKASKYDHAVVGYNSRLDAVQGAVLALKLRHLDVWNEARRTRATEYARLLAPLPLTLPLEEEGRTPVYHLYVVKTPDRGGLIAALEAAGMGFGLHYPTALHLTEAYRALGYRRGEFPISEEHADEVVSLPMFAEITAVEVARVAEAVARHLTPRKMPLAEAEGAL